jgi:hypothetical protein
MTHKYKKKTKKTKKIGGMASVRQAFQSARNRIKSTFSGKKQEKVEITGTLTPEQTLSVLVEDRKFQIKNPVMEPDEIKEPTVFDPLGMQKNTKIFTIKNATGLFTGSLPIIAAKIAGMQLYKSQSNVALLSKKIFCPNLFVKKWPMYIPVLLTGPPKVFQNFKDACKLIFLFYNYKFAINYGFLFDKSLDLKLYCIHMHYIDKQYTLNNSLPNKKVSDFKEFFIDFSDDRFTKLYAKLVLNRKPEATSSLFPSLSTFSSLPTVPSLPTMPTIPSMPTIPTMPTMPTIPSLPDTGNITSGSTKGSSTTTKASTSSAEESKNEETTSDKLNVSKVPEKIGGNITKKNKKIKGGAIPDITQMIKDAENALSTSNKNKEIVENRKKIEQAFQLNKPGTKPKNYKYFILQLLFEMHNFKENDLNNIYRQTMLDLIRELKIDNKVKFSSFPISNPSNENIICLKETAAIMAASAI